jgi:hypothetical protein
VSQVVPLKVATLQDRVQESTAFDPAGYKFVSTGKPAIGGYLVG